MECGNIVLMETKTIMTLFMFRYATMAYAFFLVAANPSTIDPLNVSTTTFSAKLYANRKSRALVS